MSLKYKITKAIDIAGLSFLSPVVLLCYGDEPRVQLRKIGRFIVMPTAAFALFLVVWAWIAPHHKTKSGEVPTPGVVWDAAKGIWTFHDREDAKLWAYTADGETRQGRLAAVNERLAELGSLESEADAQVDTATAARDAALAEQLAPLEEAYRQLRAEHDAEEEASKTELIATAESLAEGDDEGRLALLEAIRAHRAAIDAHRDELKAMRGELDAARAVKDPALVEALRAQTTIAEERQYLTKLAEFLSSDNRGERIASGEQRLDERREAFLSASGARLVNLGNQLVQEQERMAMTRESSYAKPWTLPDQILRSLACVFFGFFIGSAIAIPIGVLCGLSPTFMAATTPFIALFKPVSPIVWLPIALIIVGGFIPDPDDHWLINLLGEMPVIGWLQINPAFIASGLTVALCSLWPTLVNTALGVASIDKDHLNVARVLRLGFRDRLIKIIIPSSLPLMFAGLRISLGVGWMVLIAAELLSSSEGIGKAVWDMFNNGSSQTLAQMFVVVFVVGLIGLALDRTMIVFQRLASFDGAPTAI